MLSNLIQSLQLFPKTDWYLAKVFIGLKLWHVGRIRQLEVIRLAQWYFGPLRARWLRADAGRSVLFHSKYDARRRAIPTAEFDQWRPD